MDFLGSYATPLGILRGLPGGGVPAVAAQGPVPVCPECAAEFPSEAALASHRARKHNYVNDHRHYVHGTTCQVCLTEFWTRERLHHHLVRSVCKGRIQLLVPRLSGAEVNAWQAAERPRQRDNLRRGLSHRKAFFAATRVPGPRQICQAARPGCGCFGCRG